MMKEETYDDLEMTEPDQGNSPIEEDSQKRGRSALKKVTFDDFQITRAEQQARVDEERKAWETRQERIEKEKPSIIRFAVPRLKSLRDEMIGVQNKLPFFRKSQREDIPHGPLEDVGGAAPYFAEHERAVVRVTRRTNEEYIPEVDGAGSGVLEDEIESYTRRGILSDPMNNALESVDEDEENVGEIHNFAGGEEVYVGEEVEEGDSHIGDDAILARALSAEADGFEEDVAEGAVYQEFSKNKHADPSDPVSLEPKIEPSLKAYFDALRAFDSFPRRANDPRDPRADFVVLLGELLDILRDELDATSAMFFWVNAKKQQLVLESAALDDRAFQFLASDKRFPIELDAVSRIVSKRRPELHSSIAPQAELDLIPYYRDAIGIASFAGMPVLFGDGLVAVLTVDSSEPDQFSAETLRILTNHSKLISGLIRSYIEKYDLLASARTLDAARKLNEIVSPDSGLRALRERRNPDYVLRVLTEAASEIIDWEWLASASFDESRRLWNIGSLQSKRPGAYAPPMTPVSIEESLVGRCISSGKSMLVEALGAQSIRYNIEEDRHNAAGHSFMTIPIRTANKNYGALAIEHSEKARYTDADVETLEHLARSAASALEIIALGEIVGERSQTDLLTDLLNKRGLFGRTNEELARAMAFDEPLTFVLFEIDGGDAFASRFSQEDSDTIVLAIARLLKFGARPFDIIARPEEHSFAVLLVRTTDEDAYLWSEKMRKMIVSEVIAIGNRSYSVTPSVGISGARRDGTVEELIEGAELALERARELGGNNVIVY